jgi:hypothetical protein
LDLNLEKEEFGKEFGFGVNLQNKNKNLNLEKNKI